MRSEADVSVVAAVGAGMKGTPGIAARIFKAVAEKSVNVRMIAQGSSELNVSFIVREADIPKPIHALHQEFQLDRKHTQQCPRAVQRTQSSRSPSTRIEDEIRRIDPSLLTFFNVNTREHMERAERMLAEKSLSDKHTDLTGKNKDGVEGS